MSTKPKFQLGQPVKITGTAAKIRKGAQTTFVEAKPPQRGDAWGKTKEITEGIIIGHRSVMDGYRDGDWEEGTYYVPTPGSAKRVWLVALNLQMNPVRCFDHQVEALPMPESITVPTPHIQHPGFHTQGHFMRTAARNIKNDHPVGGYGVTSAVIKLLEDTAAAMDDRSANPTLRTP